MDILIIGVGASAGGLKALYTLFEHPVPSNVSFVVVQHLSPDFKSVTADLLASHCHREVIAIEDNMKVEANSIYVLAERKKVEIHQGKFRLTELDPNSMNNTLDLFFNSLAAAYGNRSMGIILSGGGSDGTKGAEAIKQAGGVVIAQDPETAQFDTMPSNVISAGIVDSVLAPELMMDEIINYREHNILISQFKDSNETLLKELLDLINEHTPLDFSNYKRATIVRRITRRMNQKSVGLLSDFIQFLKNNPGEIDTLAKEFMISVTEFFRDSGAFNLLKEKVIPEILANKENNSPIKIWVVGCATGQEAYSIAILVYECLEEMKKSMEVKIFASDIDKEALAIASKGSYPESVANEISEERLSKFFYREGDRYNIKEAIRNMLIIAEHDITKHPPYYKLDLISCRNLLIYLNPDLQKKILATLHYCLNPEGFLFLGPSESLGDLKMKFFEVDKKWKIYKNLESAVRLENGTYSIPSLYVKPPIKAMPALRTTPISPSDGLYEIIADVLSERTNQAGVCVDENYNILKTFGEYKKYLLPEMFNFNLLRVLPHELSIVTATGLNKANTDKKELTIKDVVYSHDNTPRSVTIYFQPIPEYKFAGKVTLVCFSDSTAPPSENVEVYDKEMHTRRYLLDLEEELKETQKKLNEAYEALEVSNLHAQSFHEELISGNEELQSTNEEVQSVNEELHTVNNQYQIKIKELTELNDDLNNYFRTTVNGLIYVDRNFIIRKFTPSAVKQINLKESDVGRPISDISTNIKFSTMVEDMQKVAESSHLIEKEVETMDRKWYKMVVLPYVRQQDSQTDGVIISFNDITDLKIAQKKLIKINKDHNTFIYSVAHDLNAPATNIESLANLLLDSIGPENSEINEIARLVRDSVVKLKETILELSDITKLEKQFSEDFVENVNFYDLLEEVKLSIHDMLIKTDLKLTYDFQAETINFSKKNLRSILMNLLTNAIKYRSKDRNPEVHIHTERNNDYTILSVRDNGIGISEDKKSKLFTIFKRVHEEEGIPGSGIGLFMIKKMITNAEGDISVESEPGKGSTFKVCFKNHTA
ncbi:CheR family methyltransferase [Negadavirga shengliensis]|uniref:CheR family methyltransferase n=1 Tax=Negadavirga shengliensis TaxID=1389218 RepID=A0ABV9T0H7_9BACT